MRNLPTHLTASAWRPIGKGPHDHEDRADSPFIGYRLRSRIDEMCNELPIPDIAPQQTSHRTGPRVTSPSWR